MRHCLDLLGNPEKTFKSVLIGGSKGKGSVAFYLSESLRASGYRVGLYTSPHLEDIRERIVVDSKWISKTEFAVLSSRLKWALRYPFFGRNAEISALPRTLRPRSLTTPFEEISKKFGNVTYFEWLTLLAFLYFKEKKVDLAVLEVGLGGRLDATNCVDPLLTVMTPISLEHTAILGNTLSKIAKEKSFLIHAKRPVVLARQEKAVQKVLVEKCKKMNARYTLTPTLSRRGRGSFISSPAKSLYALENFACVKSALQLLQKSGFREISLQKAEQAFQKKIWPGRFELIQKRPLILLDGAHNPASAERLVESVKLSYPHKKMIVMVGIANDKDAAGILTRLAKLRPERLIVTSFKSSRALSGNVLARLAKNKFKTIEFARTSDQALQRTKRINSSDHLILVTGSLYLVGEIRRICLN